MNQEPQQQTSHFDKWIKDISVWTIQKTNENIHIKKDNPNKTEGMNLDRRFLKEEIQMTRKYS